MPRAIFHSSTSRVDNSRQAVHYVGIFPITGLLQPFSSEGARVPRSGRRTAPGDTAMIQKQTAAAVMTSKLHPPRLTLQHVPRPRLIERLRQQANSPLTLVCAPAGSGKSTLLSEWLDASNLPVAWVSLDEGDNDLARFVSYVLAAVETIAPTVHFQTRDLLQAVSLPPLELLAIILSNDLDQISNDFLLVLDDYHLLDNPQIDTLLSQLLLHPPQAMHLAVATRTEPDWPLATLRARGRAMELRYGDLQFTEAESADFIRRALGDAFDQDLVAVLHEESEGWAAGLKLMMLVAGRDGSTARNWAELRSWEDFTNSLFSEVLAQQPQEVTDSLLQMSILGRFSASLCAAVCRSDDNPVEAETRARALLADLEQRSLFVVALDAHSEFYHLHHLFQGFLQERLRELKSPEEIALLHLRASEWFASRDLIEEALDHALAGRDATAAADLVARHRHVLYNREQFSRLTRLLRLLPYDVKEHNPELLLAEARIATMNWRFTEAEIFLDHAEAGLAQTSLEAARTEIAAGELAVLRGILDLWEGNAERLLTELQSALTVLPPDASHLRGVAYMGVAAAYWQLGEPAKAKSYLAELLSKTSPQLPVYATLLQAQAFLQWVDGDLTDLLDSARRLLNVSRELELPGSNWARALFHRHRALCPWRT